MSRRSLRPQLNQIRGWVRQGRTDAWIAHQLEVTVQQIQAFKREQGLEPDGDEPQGTVEEVDLLVGPRSVLAAGLQALLALERLDLLDRDLELVGDPRVGSTLAHPGADLI